MPTGSSLSLKITDAEIVTKKKQPTRGKKRLSKSSAQKKAILPTHKKPITNSGSKHTPEKKRRGTRTSTKQTTTAVKKATVKKTKPTATVREKKASQLTKQKPTLTALPPLDKLNSGQSLSVLKREPLGHLLIEHILKDAGFSGTVSTDKNLIEKYSTDESIFSIKPQIVLQPKNQRDVEIAVKTIAKHTKTYSSLSLTPRAAGTGLSGGSLTDSIVIDVCAHMHTIGPIKTKRNTTTVTVEPGVLWRDLEKKLKAHNVYLPSYPASKDICSIGGSIANNAAGPDSLRFGHCADWVESLAVTLHDGQTYTIAPLSYTELQKLFKKENALAKIAHEIYDVIKQNESTITGARPQSKKNSAGFALWDVINTSVADFESGNGTFDLTRLISGSQGTIGIITSITLRTEPLQNDTELIVIPIFDIKDAGATIVKTLDYNPINVELFDDITFNLALKNPEFFKSRLSGAQYYRVLLSMYTTYHVRYRSRTPEFTLLVTVDSETVKRQSMQNIVHAIRTATHTKARHVKNPIEKEMYWQIRRASYSLSKFQDPRKRPAAFLEDMTVPPKHLPKFFTEIKQLLKKYNVTAAVHGHGGNGHLHFYPLLDFTSKATPDLVIRMAEEFFNVALKYDGNLCGEHNDGIIRTPHLSKIFNKKTLDLFKTIEQIFDPDDIFNPGKKVNPRFDIKDSLRQNN